MRNRDVRVLIYSQDGFGLGHLRRNLNICNQIKRHCPEAAILIIADSPVAPFFKLPPKCDFIKIPTIIKVDVGVWRPNGLPMNYQELLKIRAEIIQNVMLSFQPDVFLVDHMPHGALGELTTPLQVLRRTHPETRLILGLRDILGAPDSICEQWESEGAYEMAENFYDRVCVYGCADVFDLAREYQFSNALQSKTCYNGYVCREDPAIEFDETVLEKLFPKYQEKFVLVTGGGGHDASYFMDAFLDAVRHLHPDVPFNAMIATGPFVHFSQFDLLTKKAEGLPVVVTPTGPDAIRLLHRADLVVCMAGYNTIGEILHFRKNALVIPRPGPSAEQTIRSTIMSDRGLFRSVHPSKLTPEKLARLLVERLERGFGISEERLPDLGGASKMATSLTSIEPISKTVAETAARTNNRVAIP